MTFTERFLVVTLSAFLALFLLAGIFALVKINQILKHLRSITEKAEKLADHAEHIGEFFSKSASSAAISNMVTNVVNAVREHKGKRSKKDEG